MPQRRRPRAHLEAKYQRRQEAKLAQVVELLVKAGWDKDGGKEPSLCMPRHLGPCFTVGFRSRSLALATALFGIACGTTVDPSPEEAATASSSGGSTGTTTAGQAASSTSTTLDSDETEAEPMTSGSSGSSGTDDATTASGTTGLPELPCGCPGDKGYPGCTGSPIVCGHIFASCDGGDFATCAATAEISSDENLNCVLEAIRDQTPGIYLYELGSYHSWTRRLHIEESGDHASIECHSVDLGSDCSDALGGEVDPEGAASACLALEDFNEKGSCAWDLMELSTPIAC